MHFIYLLGLVWLAATESQLAAAPQPFYFTGTNTYNLIDATAYNKSSVYNALVQHWNAGIRVRHTRRYSTPLISRTAIY